MTRPTEQPRKAVLLAAHGASDHAGHAAIVRRLADALVTRGAFDEAAVAFWKQRPFFREALATLSARDVTVIPLFSSAGYYYSTVLPREMNLHGPISHHGHRIIRLTRPLGEDPAVADVFRGHVEQALHQHQLHPHDSAVVLVGHGTTRNPRSGDTTHQHAATLRRQLNVNEVVAVFLDQPPELERIYELTRSRNLLVVPFLIGGAGHEREDIPRRIDAANPAGQSSPCCTARRVFYLPALGEHPRLVDILIGLAANAPQPSHVEQT